LLKKWLNQLANHLYEGLVVIFTALLDQWAKYCYQPQESAKAALLVIKVDEIGDYVLFRNYLQALKANQQFQVDELHLLGNQAWRSLAEKFDKGVVDHFIWLEPKSFLKKPAYRLKTARKLRSRRYEAVIYPTYSRGFFIGDQLVKLAIGYQKIGFWNYQHTLSSLQATISNRYYSNLVETGYTPLYFEFDRIYVFFKSIIDAYTELPQTPSIEVKSHERLASYQPYVVIAPGAGRLYRMWPLKYFIKIIQYLNAEAYGFHFVIIGGPDDKEKGDFLEAHGGHVVNYAGSTGLDEVPAILKGARFVIANETSIPHLAAAVGVPCVCPSNGNHYLRYHPYPDHLKAKNYYLYSLSFLKDVEDKFEQYYYGISPFDISEILPEDVLFRIKEQGLVS
jgi:ADP-heptose:LPS heptosyltransferase